MKKKVSLTIDERVYSDFKTHCALNGMKMSTRIEKLLRDDLA